jgi:hypothetical protein
VTQPKDRVGRWGFLAFIVALFAIYLVNIFGPTPPSVDAIALSGPLSLLLFAWPYWVDRHRVRG